MSTPARGPGGRFLPKSAIGAIEARGARPLEEVDALLSVAGARIVAHHPRHFALPVGAVEDARIALAEWDALPDDVHDGALDTVARLALVLTRILDEDAGEAGVSVETAQRLNDEVRWSRQRRGA